MSFNFKNCLPSYAPIGDIIASTAMTAATLMLVPNALAATGWFAVNAAAHLATTALYQNDMISAKIKVVLDQMANGLVLGAIPSSISGGFPIKALGLAGAHASITHTDKLIKYYAEGKVSQEYDISALPFKHLISQTIRGALFDKTSILGAGIAPVIRYVMSEEKREKLTGDFSVEKAQAIDVKKKIIQYVIATQEDLTEREAIKLINAAMKKLSPDDYYDLRLEDAVYEALQNAAHTQDLAVSDDRINEIAAAISRLALEYDNKNKSDYLVEGMFGLSADFLIGASMLPLYIAAAGNEVTLYPLIRGLEFGFREYVLEDLADLFVYSLDLNGSAINAGIVSSPLIEALIPAQEVEYV